MTMNVRATPANLDSTARGFGIADPIYNAGTTKDNPFVTVIMPIRNEADFIEACIRSVSEGDYPADRFEILVVDGMSDDGTREIVSRLASVDPRIRLLDNPDRGVAPAMNLGIRAAKGELFVRIDGHALVEAGFLTESVRCLEAHPDAWVVGGYIETASEGFVGGVIAAAMRSPFGVGNSHFRTRDYEGWVDTLAFGTHHRWVVDRIGWFDEELVRNQDDDFNQRIREGGGKIWLSSSIRSRYFSRSGFGKLWRQYFQYGFWRIRTFQKHRRPGALRQLVPLVFVSTVLLLALAATVWSPALWLLEGAVGAYGLALLGGSVQVGLRSGWRFAFLAPLAFVVLHFAYGLGSLWGLVRFGLLHGVGVPRGAEHSLSR